MPPLRRILLIGDSGRFARTLASDAGLRDVSFERTAGAADTLRRVRALPCDLVVTDRSTPIAEDLALVEELRLLRPGVPVIAVAPDATPTDVIEAMRALMTTGWDWALIGQAFGAIAILALILQSATLWAFRRFAS